VGRIGIKRVAFSHQALELFRLNQSGTGLPNLV
jgi:hypothetical protein